MSYFPNVLTPKLQNLVWSYINPFKKSYIQTVSYTVCIAELLYSRRSFQAVGQLRTKQLIGVAVRLDKR